MHDAQSIMSKDIVTVNQNTPIYEVMSVLIGAHISGLPVVDDENNLVGMITEKDLMPLFKHHSLTNATVADYMTKDVKVFTPETTIDQISEFFAQYSYRRAPIVKDGKLVGIVARRDIISLIIRLWGQKGTF